MPSKTLEALVIGVAIWASGAITIILLGQVAYFPSIAIPAAFLAIPLMYFVTRFHLRDIRAIEQTFTAIRLGIIVTAVQFPLDALGWLAMTQWGYPPLSQTTRDALIVGLDIGYFGLLVVPYWIAKPKHR